LIHSLESESVKRAWDFVGTQQGCPSVLDVSVVPVSVLSLLCTYYGDCVTLCTLDGGGVVGRRQRAEL